METPVIEKPLFTAVRFLMLGLAILAVLGLGVLGLVAISAIPSGSSRINPQKVFAAMDAEKQSGGQESWEATPQHNARNVPEMPKELIPLVSGAPNSIEVIHANLEPLDWEAKVEFLDNLAEVVASAKAANRDIVDAANKYIRLKNERIVEITGKRMERWAILGSVAASAAGLVFLLVLIVLGLVLLAIERNTRPNSSRRELAA